jgi:large subunit ribosomal protein L4
MNIDVYNQAGEKVGTTRLSAQVFDIKPKPELIHQVVVAKLANLRKPWAHTKTRGEVSGGGKKPWRQKGTGRARAGSIRSPLWRGGGVIFGPRKERSYKKKINRKVRRQALLMVLSDKAVNKKIIILEDLKLATNKTKEFQKILNQLPNKNKKTVFLYQKEELSIVRAIRNIANLKVLSIESLDILELLKNEYLLMTKKTLKELEKKLKQ